MDQSRRSHDAPAPCPSIYHSEMNSVLNGVLWDMGQVHCGICEIGLLPLHNCTTTSKRECLIEQWHYMWHLLKTRTVKTMKYSHDIGFWTNIDLLSTRPCSTNFIEIWILVYNFSVKKMHVGRQSTQFCPFCPGLTIVALLCHLWRGSEQIVTWKHRNFEEMF